jgi:hypothetical protein
MYLVLAQQKFMHDANRNMAISGKCCAKHPSGKCQVQCVKPVNDNVVYYGRPLYLSMDMTHFEYMTVYYDLKLDRVEKYTGVVNSSAISGRMGPINAKYKRFVYNTDGGLEFTVYQVKHINKYLRDKYDFKFVTFAGMRLEPIVK